MQFETSNLPNASPGSSASNSNPQIQSGQSQLGLQMQSQFGNVSQFHSASCLLSPNPLLSKSANHSAAELLLLSPRNLSIPIATPLAVSQTFTLRPPLPGSNPLKSKLNQIALPLPKAAPLTGRPLRASLLFVASFFFQ